MKHRSLIVSIVLGAVLLFPGSATALTMTQFARICESRDADCIEHPFIRAYIGGALDLIATLDEQTDYLAQIYCKPPAELFDVPSIIRHMETKKRQYADKNAMFAVIRYLEEQGGC